MFTFGITSKDPLSRNNYHKQDKKKKKNYTHPKNKK